jgi:hypothetical protein
MSSILVVALALLAIAVVLIELRALREGDERERTAPGFALVTCGVFMLALGVAAAVAGDEPLALIASLAGLATVALGATRHRQVTAH